MEKKDNIRCSPNTVRSVTIDARNIEKNRQILSPPFYHQMSQPSPEINHEKFGHQVVFSDVDEYISRIDLTRGDTLPPILNLKGSQLMNVNENPSRTLPGSGGSGTDSLNSVAVRKRLNLDAHLKSHHPPRHSVTLANETISEVRKRLLSSSGSKRILDRFRSLSTSMGSGGSSGSCNGAVEECCVGPPADPEKLPIISPPVSSTAGQRRSLRQPSIRSPCRNSYPCGGDSVLQQLPLIGEMLKLRTNTSNETQKRRLNFSLSHCPATGSQPAGGHVLDESLLSRISSMTNHRDELELALAADNPHYQDFSQRTTFGSPSSSSGCGGSVSTGSVGTATGGGPSYLRRVSENNRCIFISKSPFQSFDTTFDSIERIDDEEIYRTYLLHSTCYDIMPDSARLAVIDSRLQIGEAFRALALENIRAAPVWDGESSQFTGILTITDFVRIMDIYYHTPRLSLDVVEAQTVSKWLNEIAPLKKHLICVSPENSLLFAAYLLNRYRIHRLPVLNPREGNILHIITHKRLLRHLWSRHKEMQLGDDPRLRQSLLRSGLLKKFQQSTADYKEPTAASHQAPQPPHLHPTIDSPNMPLFELCSEDLAEMEQQFERGHNSVRPSSRLSSLLGLLEVEPDSDPSVGVGTLLSNTTTGAVFDSGIEASNGSTVSSCGGFHTDSMSSPNEPGSSSLLLGGGRLSLGSTSGVFTVRHETSIVRAMRLFLEHRISALPVVDESDRLLDILSKSNCMNIVTLNMRKELNITVADVLAERNPREFKGVLFCCPSDSLFQIMEKFAHNNVHRFVVVNDASCLKVVGMLSLSDLLGFLLRRSSRHRSLSSSSCFQLSQPLGSGADSAEPMGMAATPLTPPGDAVLPLQAGFARAGSLKQARSRICSNTECLPEVDEKSVDLGEALLASPVVCSSASVDASRGEVSPHSAAPASSPNHCLDCEDDVFAMDVS